MAIQQRIRARPAHAPGPTFLSYTPNGRKLITVGVNNAIRVFTTGSDAEPVNIDDCQESNTAVAAANDFFITGSEDGMVCKYSLETNSYDGILVRCTLPVRDVALSPDGMWAAVASDELVVKVVNTQDMTRVLYLREQTKAVKHVSFDPSGKYLTVSCSDGIIYVYGMNEDQPELLKKVDGLVKALDTEAEASSKAVWHPDGRALAASTPVRDIQVLSKNDWERQRAFKSGHTGDITALSWSPNGGLLASTGSDRKLLLWDTKTQKIVKTHDDIRATVLALAWHPTENILSYTNNDGELFIHTDFVPAEQLPVLQKELQRAPFIHDPLSETSGNIQHPLTNGHKEAGPARNKRHRTPDSLDEFLGPAEDSDDGFIEDDDGAGYAEETNVSRKRPFDALGSVELPSRKRQAAHGLSQPRIHPSFQPGSTPWRGNRRYLCLNLTGFVWTVDQDTHHTVTVEFYDRELHRDFHFTDPFLYDKACLNDNGALFACPPSKEHPAMIYYRPHETWTTRTDWRTQLPANEKVIAISLSDSFVVVTTSANYVRVYTLFGVPYRIYRQKSSPAVTCASWRDYVMTIGNGPVAADGSTQLLYTIENVKRDEICQSEDIVALAPDAQLRSVFFSDKGDPCIYDSTGVLLTLQHWRTPAQARWIPLLDTTQLARLASGRKQESYWPVAVAAEQFHCIILKGGDAHPPFPRPLLSEFPFQIPLTAAAAKRDRVDGASGVNGNEDDDTENPDDPALTETQALEEAFVRGGVLLSLLEDQAAATRATAAQRAELGRRELELDKTLLQLLAAECREGEERGMRALEIVGLMRDRTGRMLEAAGKVAARFGREVLGDKIREMAERRLVGLDVEDEDEIMG